MTEGTRRKKSWQIWRDRRGRLSPLRLVTLFVLFAPVAKALFDVSVIAHSARPINELIHRAGFWALVFLGVTLAVTPFRRILRYGQLIDVRRMIGVGAFAYIAAHLALFFADQSYSVVKFLTEIFSRVYLIIGITAWTGLAILALTSTDAMVRRLGGLKWRRLHQIIYAIALLALIHYFQQTKADVTVPIFAASLFGWLLLYRVVVWWCDVPELSTLGLLILTFAVTALSLLGEAVGIAIAFHVSPLVVLETVFDFEVGIRPGWEVLAAGLCVVVIDLIRSRAGKGRAQAVAAE
jgi:sulfoxide reductase heme-binding subunit YedZ